MKTEKNILVAFFLNLSFSLLEFFGGALTGSTAIVSDAVHDLGDALSIGVSYFLERKSHHRPDEVYTYGYIRYSVMGSIFTTLILLIGSAISIGKAVERLIQPIAVDVSGMTLFAVFGVIANGAAAFFTREGDSINQKAVNLHMLEDVLGWAVVLVGAILMRFTNFSLLDPIMSIGIALFILVNAAKTMGEALEPLLEKAPHGIDLPELQTRLQALDGVLSVHHIHLWSMDGQTHCATMHIVTDGDASAIKAAVRNELREYSIRHATLELESPGEHCEAQMCCTCTAENSHHHGHSHAHHHHH